MTWNRATSAVAAAAGFVAGLYGEWTAAMRALLLLMAADYVTGCLCALLGRSNKTESGHWLSSAAYKGLLHKGMIMLVILVAAQLDRAAAMGASSFKSMAVFYYLSCEGLSIMENVGLLGVPLPPLLRGALEALRQRGEPPKKDMKEKVAVEGGSENDEQ